MRYFYKGSSMNTGHIMPHSMFDYTYGRMAFLLHLICANTMKDYTIYIGIIAGILTAISMLPQLIKIIREKKTEDISFVMLFILLAGILGWVYYGILKADYPIIVTNSFSFLINVMVILFSIKYRNKKPPKVR